ncbi:type II toxin-antitoxin system Phd/YefM family antitoxin [Ramlibacter alkalitolerans]|uniref:Antitoxin n=1 Tax=Ramlibacter alkalitolerans TaxID=2039631 RepID=A0ABS1JU84_9BURK|nr:type II toxin-antitoxin system prevent-host-death family antitoxin [Ramlibacter alkalitolerans]MBL0427864.1 type II toxin-antitoxin system prevent-host-death family antitoxin [Ramlibacter alkalitolerans]
MKTVSLREARSTLSRLVEALESGSEQEVVITRRGQPVAKLLPAQAAPASARIGVAKGLFQMPESDAALDAEVSRLFT